MSAGLDTGDCLTYLRQVLSDTNTGAGARWSQDFMMQCLDRGHKRVVRDVLFPDCRVTVPIVPGVQLYQMPLMLKTKAVYLDGQLIVPSDLPTLEGRQLGYWDNSAVGQNPIAPYGDSPVGTTGYGSPAWTVQEPLSYPDTSGNWLTPCSGIAPDAQPWADGQRARYYWRGGWIGIIPLPSGNATLELDGVRQPDTITYTLNSSSVFQPQILPTPDNFIDAIVWAACAIAKYSDDGQRADAQRETAEKNYEREKRKLLEWRGEFPGEQRNGPKLDVQRGRGASGIRIRKRAGRYW